MIDEVRHLTWRGRLSMHAGLLMGDSIRWLTEVVTGAFRDWWRCGRR